MQKTVFKDGDVPKITDYLDGYQYVNNKLAFFATAEGYVSNTVVQDYKAVSNC